MRSVNLTELSDIELVKLFEDIAIGQFEADELGDTRKINRLYDRKELVEAELKLRPGDHRRVLMTLYDHPNVQVRLNAAKSTLAVAPVAARQLIQAIADSKEYPQAGDAGMCLWTLDEGIFKSS